MVRQKNPHPKRAENARTVVVASDREEREAREFREEEEERVLCLRIPDDDDDDDDEMTHDVDDASGERHRADS